MKSAKTEALEAMVKAATGHAVEIEAAGVGLLITAPTAVAVRAASEAMLPLLRAVDPTAKLTRLREEAEPACEGDEPATAFGIVSLSWSRVIENAPAAISAAGDLADVARAIPE